MPKGRRYPDPYPVKQYHIPQVDMSHLYFRGSDPVVCSHFGCNKQLSLTESMCGSKCAAHMGTPTKTVWNNL